MKINAVTYKEAAQKENITLALFSNDPVEKQDFFSYIPDAAKKILTAFAAQEFTGEDGEIKSLWLDSSYPRRIVLFGLGDIKKWNERKSPLVSRRIVQYAKKEKLKECAVFFPKGLIKDIRDTCQEFSENSLMAHFEFIKYKEQPKNAPRSMSSLFFAVDNSQLKDARQGIEVGIIIGEEINLCRDLANTPGSDMTPALLAHAAVQSAKRTG
ncbi:MAG: M17 family peptidase N-terminal domain-containing protein, partial [Candidatus Sungbacteria bacterium]|nr:M17 family peptidase N-terminal domain-containing protein [Candidatus Sungbacteria bacterium]